MGLIETSISEEAPYPISIPPPSHSNGNAGRSPSSSSSRQVVSSSSSSSPSSTDLAPRQSNQKVQEKNKVIAAMVGATLTALTMTPFDVVKTRLQTQAPSTSEPLFVPSSRLPPATRSTTSPWPPPIASTSKSTPSPDNFETSLSKSASKSATNTTTCCQKTYFSSNDKSVLCRFDPRHSTSSLPASGSHPASITAARTAFVHHLAPANAGSILLHGPSGALLANACLYPDPFEAAIALPSSSSAGSTASSSRHLNGFWDAVIKITRNEGLSSLWRGTAPALAMSIPGQVVYMVGYDWGRRTAFESAPSWAYSAVPNADGRNLKTSYLTAVPLIAGGLSRTLVAALTSPLELVRTRLQSTSENTSIRSVIKALRAEGGGLSSAWRGLPPTLWRDVPFSAIYWAGYEAIKRGVTGGKGMGEGWKDQSVQSEFAVAFVCGAGSGIIAATMTNPFDVVKTRRQALVEAASSTHSAADVPLTKTFPILFDIAKKEGWAGLMRGLTPRLAKVGPACGIMIASYEGLGRLLD